MYNLFPLFGAQADPWGMPIANREESASKQVSGDIKMFAIESAYAFYTAKSFHFQMPENF